MHYAVLSRKSISWKSRTQSPTCSAMIALVFVAFSSFGLTQSWTPITSSTQPTVSDGTYCQITSATGSNSIMTCEGEHTLEQGFLLGTLPTLGKEWKMSLEFKPLEEPHSQKKLNIIKLVDSTPTRMDPDPTGIFSIWTLPDHPLHFSSASKSLNKNYNGATQVGKWTTISISQERVETENCIKYRQFIIINGEEILKRINKSPQEFHQVEVYASSTSRRSQLGVIKNLFLGTRDTGFCSKSYQR